MSYYDKYLKYKNKYIQYKNKLEINMLGGANKSKKHTPNTKDKSNDSDHVGGSANDIFNIAHLTDTPVVHQIAQNKSTDDNKVLSIDMLTNTPALSDFVGGTYKPKNKQNQKHNKLLKLLEAPSEDNESHTSASFNSVSTFDKVLSTRPRIDSKSHRYFGKEDSITPSSSSTSDDSSSSSSI